MLLIAGHEQDDARQDRDRHVASRERQDRYQHYGERGDELAHQEVRGRREGRGRGQTREGVPSQGRWKALRTGKSSTPFFTKTGLICSNALCDVDIRF